MYADTLFALRSKRKQRIRIHTLHMLFTYVILSKMAPGWRGGDELLNKVVIFVFFAQKKYYHSFVKLRLNHWCHMDYFNDVLTMLLDCDHDRILAVNRRIRELSEFIKKYLNLCSEDEWRSYRFGTTWRWVIHDRIFTFGWSILFSPGRNWYCKYFFQNDIFLYFKLKLCRFYYEVMSIVSIYWRAEPNKASL